MAFKSRQVGPGLPAISVKVEGVNRLAQLAETLGVDIENAIVSGLERIGGHLAERAKENAPIKTGALRKSIKATEVKKSKGYFTIAVEVDVPYAVEMHEYLVKTISRRPTYQLGKRSVEYDYTFSGIEGGVGGGYIIRVLNSWTNQYSKWLEESVKDALDDAGKKATFTAEKDALDPLKVRIKGTKDVRVSRPGRTRRIP